MAVLNGNRILNIVFFKLMALFTETKSLEALRLFSSLIVSYGSGEIKTIGDDCVEVFDVLLVWCFLMVVLWEAQQ